MYNFYVSYETIDACDFENIHMHLMQKHNIVLMTRFFTVFI